MRKLLVAGIVSLMTIGTAYAGPRTHYSHSYHGGGHHYGSHYHSPYYSRGRNYAPWVAGAIGLGIAAGIAGSYYYNQVCARQFMGYDTFGQPVWRTYCE